MTIHQTILEQLGGNKFVAMTGARDFINTGNGLSFRIPKIPGSKISHVRITLNNDLYDVEFLSIRGFKAPVTVSSHTGVYAENLASLFSQQTGFALSL